MAHSYRLGLVIGRYQARIRVGPDIYHRGCAYTVLQTVQRPGLCSAAYGTVYYKESLTSFEIRVGHSPGFRLLSVAILPWLCRKQYSYIYIFIYIAQKKTDAGHHGNEMAGAINAHNFELRYIDECGVYFRVFTCFQHCGVVIKHFGRYYWWLWRDSYGHKWVMMCAMMAMKRQLSTCHEQGWGPGAVVKAACLENRKSSVRLARWKQRRSRSLSSTEKW